MKQGQPSNESGVLCAELPLHPSQARQISTLPSRLDDDCTIRDVHVRVLIFVDITNQRFTGSFENIETCRFFSLDFQLYYHQAEGIAAVRMHALRTPYIPARNPIDRKGRVYQFTIKWS